MSRYSSEWDKVTLSDASTIKGLLKFRYKYDLLMDDDNRYGLDSNSDLCGLSDDVLCLYADLDKLIKKANFNGYQCKVLNLYTCGYIESDIAEELGVEMQSINRMIDNMCEVLCELNYQDWKLDYVFWNKVKVNSNYKKCSKCKEFLPSTEEYFSPNPLSKDSFYSICRKCKQIIDKNRKNE